MTVDSSARPLAVLDTSFWTLAYRAEVAANCLDLFQIVVPRAVESEIRAIQADAPRREYPYATLFRHLRDKPIEQNTAQELVDEARRVLDRLAPADAPEPDPPDSR